jgi:hypothetical protein
MESAKLNQLALVVTGSDLTHNERIVMPKIVLLSCQIVSKRKVVTRRLLSKSLARFHVVGYWRTPSRGCEVCLHVLLYRLPKIVDQVADELPLGTSSQWPVAGSRMSDIQVHLPSLLRSHF